MELLILTTYYEPLEVISNPYLKDNKCGHDIKSETTTIIPVKIDLKTLGIPRRVEIILVDLPGNDDSR
jgi:hypothetical protein